MHDDKHLTGTQTEFARDTLLVSKATTGGVITYANAVFCTGAGYKASELLGKPHNMVRHPDMPSAAFGLMWETLAAQKEYFAYVINRCANGNHYWVFAHVVPDIDPDNGETMGFHSTRRRADPQACTRAAEVYRKLLEVEAKERNAHAAAAAGRRALSDILAGAGVSYEQWCFSLSSL